jgi:putative FmdB family regulatory protein
MPIYGFLCASCGHQDDLIQKINDAFLKSCPKCKNKTFEKQVSAPNFQLTGSGWYATDFKNKESSGDKQKPKQSSTNKGIKKDD